MTEGFNKLKIKNEKIKAESFGLRPHKQVSGEKLK